MHPYIHTYAFTTHITLCFLVAGFAVRTPAIMSQNHHFSIDFFNFFVTFHIHSFTKTNHSLRLLSFSMVERASNFMDFRGICINIFFSVLFFCSWNILNTRFCINVAKLIKIHFFLNINNLLYKK